MRDVRVFLCKIITMDRQLLRTMTLKSVIGFGYENIRSKTVGKLIEQGKHIKLISMYYGLDKINFTQDVMDILGIKKTIQKPGKIIDLAERNNLTQEAISNLNNDTLDFIEKMNEISKERKKKYSKSMQRESFMKYRKKLVLRNLNQKNS